MITGSPVVYLHADVGSSIGLHADAGIYQFILEQCLIHKLVILPTGEGRVIPHPHGHEAGYYLAGQDEALEHIG